MVTGEKTPRTYLGVELTNELIAGKEYCLKFHVSMSDMSKYAVNNIGMYISKERIEEATDGKLSYEPQIISITNNVYNKQFLWEDVCGTYLAKGGEKYIVIGNFATDAETKQEKVRLSRDFSGRQKDDGYYYVDDVSVIATEKISAKDCSCDQIAGGKMSVENKSFKGTENSGQSRTNGKIHIINSDGSKAGVLDTKKAAKLAAGGKESAAEEQFNIEETAIYFDTESEEHKVEEQGKIDMVVDYLVSNPEVEIEIVGHIDPLESGVKILGKKRAFKMKKILTDAGVSADQLTYSSAKSGELISKTDPDKNQRVTFKLK